MGGRLKSSLICYASPSLAPGSAVGEKGEKQG